MLKPLFTAVLILMLSSGVSAAVVKKSTSGICHVENSAHYERTKNFKPFDTLNECLSSGGRLPSSYKPSSSSKAPSSTGYSRKSFKHWSDEDKNCINTRHEMLKAQSTGPVVMSDNGCRVIRGRWNDPYTGKIFYESKQVDVDHLIPLKWAWDNGADKWSSEKREQFANDERNLFAVDASANRSKGAKGAKEWLPPNKKFHCQYVTRYLRVLIIYEFPSSAVEEHRKLRNKAC